MSFIAHRKHLDRTLSSVQTSHAVSQILILWQLIDLEEFFVVKKIPVRFEIKVQLLCQSCPDDIGSRFLRKVCKFLPDRTALLPIEQNYSRKSLFFMEHKMFITLLLIDHSSTLSSESRKQCTHCEI